MVMVRLWMLLLRWMQQRCDCAASCVVRLMHVWLLLIMYVMCWTHVTTTLHIIDAGIWHWWRWTHVIVWAKILQVHTGVHGGIWFHFNGCVLRFGVHVCELWVFGVRATIVQRIVELTIITQNLELSFMVLIKFRRKA